MKTNTLLIGVLSLGLLAFVSCGGSKYNKSQKPLSTVTGQFVDTYVSGLGYACQSGTKGTTNDKGEFTCNVGNEVSFYIGKYFIGSAPMNEIIRPKDLYPEASASEINVAQLLLTLDVDGNASNGISIPSDYDDLDDETTKMDDSDFDTIIGSIVNPRYDVLVTEADAIEHLDKITAFLAKEELTTLLAGKKLYNVYTTNGIGYMDELDFDDALTYYDYESMHTDQQNSGKTYFSIEDGKIILTRGSSYLKNANSKETDYIVFDVNNISDDNKINEYRFYTDHAKGKAYYDTLVEASQSNY